MKAPEKPSAYEHVNLSSVTQTDAYSIDLSFFLRMLFRTYNSPTRVYSNAHSEKKQQIYNNASNFIIEYLAYTSLLLSRLA